ncbi:MAG: NADPH-dependent FMN reductase [Acidobacteriaceae bacterium]
MKIPIILGSVRSERVGIRVADYVMYQLRERGHEPMLVDAQLLDLPLLDTMYKEIHSQPEHPLHGKLTELANLYRDADGFVIVSAEYNHSIPPGLSNLLDYFLEEYFFRPSAIVCYSAGSFGGVRAAMQLRALLGEIGMPSISSILPIPKAHLTLTPEGRSLAPNFDRRSARFLDEFEWYMRAMKAEREKGVPY